MRTTRQVFVRSTKFLHSGAIEFKISISPLHYRVVKPCRRPVRGGWFSLGVPECNVLEPDPLNVLSTKSVQPSSPYSPCSASAKRSIQQDGLDMCSSPPSHPTICENPIDASGPSSVGRLLAGYSVSAESDATRSTAGGGDSVETVVMSMGLSCVEMSVIM